MLSSRLALAVGTLSLVTVTSISTVVLVNDGAQRLGEPPIVAAPRPSPPVFRAPPLVVPETPGTIVANPVVERPAPRQGPVRVDPVVAPDQSVVEPVEPPAPAPAPEPPAVTPPVTEEPVVYPPLYTPTAVDLPGKGKHLGQLKNATRGKGPKHPKG